MGVCATFAQISGYLKGDKQRCGKVKSTKPSVTYHALQTI